MLMFWDALREAARRRQDKKSNIPSRNDCFSAEKKTKTEFYSEDKKRIFTDKKREKKNSIVFSFQDCGTFQLIIFCATPVDTVIGWLSLIVWVAVVKCNFSASVWFYSLNLHFGTSDRCCYWNTEWLKIFTQFRLRLGANCVNFLSSVCKLLNPVTTTLLYSNLILIITFKKD